MTDDRELGPAKAVTDCDRVRSDGCEVERTRRTFGAAVPSIVKECKAEAIRINALKHWLETMRVSEPSMKKDCSMRSVAVGNTVHVDVPSWSARGGIMRR